MIFVLLIFIGRKIIILIYDVVVKTPYSSKPLRILFDRLDSYIRKQNRTRYLTLFHSDKKYEISFDRIRYLTMLKNSISDICSRKY